jgi:Flp pilus assembly pilin Flp
MPLFSRLFADEHGQDLTEYSLILCVIALAVIVILGVNQGSVTKIWGITQNNLNAGVCSAVIGTS